MRFASPNESREIIRENLGFYHSIVVSGIYEFEDPKDDFTTPQSFIGPLKYCIDKHAALAVIVKDAHTEKAYYQPVSTIDLNNHIQIIQSHSLSDVELAIDEPKKNEQYLLYLLIAPWSSAFPPWKIVILPLSASENLIRSRCLITITFSHALGDGISGLVFHHTLLEAFRKPVDGGESMRHRTQVRELSPPFDTPQRLQISRGYLFAPLMGAVLPESLANVFGFKAIVANNNAGTWTGAPIYIDPTDPTATRIKLVEVDNSDLVNALGVARKHSAKLTAVMHQLIISALDKAIPDPKVTNWLSQTAVNMRPTAEISDDEMGTFVTGYFHPQPQLTDHRCFRETTGLPHAS